MTNPVDELATWLHRRGGLDPKRVVGYTLNDQLRFRSGIAAALGVPSRDVDAWVIGEHGDGQVPLFDRITVQGRPVTLTEEQHAATMEYVDTWYVKHVALDSGRTSTWSSGLGGARMVDALTTGVDRPHPGSTVLHGEFGISGVSMGAPLLLGPDGVRQVLDWPLAEDEQTRIKEAATRISAAADSLLATRRAADED